MVIASLFARLYANLIRAQRLRAEREIALHRHLLPREMESKGNTLSGRNEKAIPFSGH